MSGDEQGYNGYTNYETWCVSLWLDNDEGSYRHWTSRAEFLKDMAKEIPQVEDGTWTEDEGVLFTLAEWIKNDVEAKKPTGESDMFSNLMEHSLRGVNWHEVAGSFTEE